MVSLKILPKEREMFLALVASVTVHLCFTWAIVRATPFSGAKNFDQLAPKRSVILVADLYAPIADNLNLNLASGSVPNLTNSTASRSPTNKQGLQSVRANRALPTVGTLPSHANRGSALSTLKKGIISSQPTHTSRLSVTSAKSSSATAVASPPVYVRPQVRKYRVIDKGVPSYPKGALDRRVEGDCSVSYTINTDGTTQDLAVVGPCHPLFRKSSLEAAKRFLYHPQLLDGSPQPVFGVINTFHYRMN